MDSSPRMHVVGHIVIIILTVTFNLYMTTVLDTIRLNLIEVSLLLAIVISKSTQTLLESSFFHLRSEDGRGMHFVVSALCFL